VDKDADGNDKILQTDLSKEENQRDQTKPGDDESPNSHGTKVASKAAGRRYGLAKEVCEIQML
jgi:hypothetical protein